MHIFMGELLGTMLLILFGNGVVANVLLNKTKGNNSGWIVITAGWAFAVFVGVFSSNAITGAHLNPAVTIGLAAIGGKTPQDVTVLSQIHWYLLGQFGGAFIGATLVWLMYLPHWAETKEPGLKLACFSTGPAIRNVTANLISEIIGTVALVLPVLAIGQNAPVAGLAPFYVAALVFGIGLSLGGPTGYAINPARDLGPRLAYFVLPIAGKGDPDWEYAWIPVVGPIIGGVLGAVLWQFVFIPLMMV